MDIEEDPIFDKFDIENRNNPQMVTIVARDIFAYLKSNEVKEFFSKTN